MSIDLLVKTGHLFMRTVFTIKSSEDLKIKYKPGSDSYLGQTLSRLEAKKRNLRNSEPEASVAKISLLSL